MEIYTTKFNSQIASLSRGSKNMTEDGCKYCSVQYMIGGKTRESFIYDPSWHSGEVSNWMDDDIYNAFILCGLSPEQISDVMRELWNGPAEETLYVMAR